MADSSSALLYLCFSEPRAPPREQTTYESSKQSRINLPFVRGAPKGAIWVHINFPPGLLAVLRYALIAAIPLVFYSTFVQSLMG